MKAVTSLKNIPVTSGAKPFSSSAPSIGNLSVVPLTLPVSSSGNDNPKFTILDKSLLLELQKLVKSFQAQVRNSVALIKWLHAKTVNTTLAVSSTGQELLTWQSSFGESLSFRFSTNPEAFTLFADTLLRKSYFLHHHAQIDPANQLIKVRVVISRLPELEQELSIVFENIKPVNYLETQLLQKKQQPMRFRNLQAS